MMNTVMQKPSSVGEKRTCPDCDVEVMGKEHTSTYQGKTTTKIRWANLDGSWHITKDSDGFKHQSSSSQVQGGSDTEKNQVTTISEERKKSLYDHYGGRLGITDTDNDLGDLATLQVEHQQVGGSKEGAKVAFKWAGLIEIWKTITKSAEIGEVAYSSQVLNGGNGVSSKGSFHTSSAVKDLGSSRQVATLPTPPFFSENIRWIAKCVKHGVICNEDDYKCKQCVEEYMDRQFATGGTIDRGLLL